MKRDADPDTVDEVLAGPRLFGDELRLELLLAPDELCEDAGVVDVVELLDEAGAVGFVVCVADVLGVALVEALTALVVGLELEGHGVEEGVC